MVFQASIITVEVNIPQKIHSRLLGGGRRLILDIQDECGGVHIKFPPEKTTSDKVFMSLLCTLQVFVFFISHLILMIMKQKRKK